MTTERSYRKTEKASETELRGVSFFSNYDLQWEPWMGIPVEGTSFVCGMYPPQEGRRDLILHYLFKAHTPPTTYINLKNEDAVANAICEVLKKRYPPMSYKTEWFDINNEAYRLRIMCSTITEGPLQRSEFYRKAVIKELDEALQKLPL